MRLPFSVLDPIEGDVLSILWEPEMISETGNLDRGSLVTNWDNRSAGNDYDGFNVCALMANQCVLYFSPF